MIKEERQKYLMDLLSQYKFLKVRDIVNELKITDMTVRRDFQELEDKGLIIRVHGGARIIEDNKNDILTELSHREKQHIHLNEKLEIAKIIAENIFEDETVFLGAGTTIELVYEFLTVNHAKIITNSIHVFDKFKHDSRFELILIGGSYRSKTGAFVGTIANDFISGIHVMKSFIGVNGLDTSAIYTSNEDEGLTKKCALNIAEQRFIVADHHKINKKDFYSFYSLKDADYLITDSMITAEDQEIFGKKIPILSSKVRLDLS